jgi:DNA-directed RNA polymerase specialized sigma24 family protein
MAMAVLETKNTSSRLRGGTSGISPSERTQTESGLPVFTEEVVREEPVLTQSAFSRLLYWLDDGIDSHGEKYLEMRRRLVSYFDRRNRTAAEDLADETLNRVSKTLEQSGTIAITPPARYCYIVARFVLLEDFRRERKHVGLEDPRSASVLRFRVTDAAADPGDDRAVREQRLDCLDRCLQELRAGQRELIVEYYRDMGRQKIDRRRRLAEGLGITMNALGIRACRIRDSLMACVQGCRQQPRQI